MKSNANIYIVHGYNASSRAHWFPWLKKRLQENGLSVFVMDMPDSQAPNVGIWDGWLRDRIGEIDEETVFVGHSLGCIALLRYLQTLSQKIKGIVMISGFYEAIPDLPVLDPFVCGVINFAHIGGIAQHRLTIGSLDDPIVPYANTVRLAEQLDARMITMETGGHFLGSDGFVEFPLVFDEIALMFEGSAG